MRKLLLSFLLLASAVLQAATPEAVPGEFLIRFKSAEKGREFLANPTNRSLGQYRILQTPAAPIALVRFNNPADSARSLRAMTGVDHIQYIEPNYIYRVPAGQDARDARVNRAPELPDDAKFAELWGLYNKGDQGGLAGADVNAVNAWRLTTGRKEVIVAVIDTGIDYKHEDLAANMWKNEKEIAGNGKDDDGNGFVDDVYGYDFANHDADPMDDHSHGTHCAGTIGAVQNNKIGVAGVMGQVRLMPVKFLSASGSGSLAAAVEAIGYATKMGAHVMSNSWGGGGYSAALFEAIKLAESRGQIFVAAAGNSRSDNDVNPTYPASYQVSNVISVAAMDRAGKPASFTCYGKKSVHVAAPGVNILSTTPGNTYKSFSGTSMATPHVAGIVGLVLAKQGTRAAPTMRERLIQTSKKHADLGNISASGGFADAAAAISGKPSRK